MKLLFWDDSPVATLVITYGILFTYSKTWAIHFLFIFLDGLDFIPHKEECV